MTRAISLITVALLALSLPGGEVWAKGKPAHAGKGNGHVAAAGARHCPPGLAKKSPHCVPPGLAKKGVTAGDLRDRDGNHSRNDDDDHFHYEERHITRIVDPYGRRIAVGDIVDDGFERYVVVRDLDRYRLPPLAPGEVYLQVGDAALRLDRDTQKVLTIIALSDLLSR